MTLVCGESSHVTQWLVVSLQQSERHVLVVDVLISRD